MKTRLACSAFAVAVLLALTQPAPAQGPAGGIRAKTGHAGLFKLALSSRDQRTSIPCKRCWPRPHAARQSLNGSHRIL
jgi:hypothetical protein